MSRPGRPQLLLIGASVSWGTSTVTSKYALEGLTATDLLGVEVGVAAVLLVAAAAFTGNLRASPHWRAYALLAFFEPALTFALFNTGLAHTSATDAALLVSLESVFAVLLAVALLHEHPGALVFGAAVLGVAGAALVSTGGDMSGASLGGNLLVIAGVLAASMYVVLARRVAGREAALTVTAYQFVFAFLMVLPVALAGHSHLAHADAGHLAAGFATGVLGSAVPFLLYNLGGAVDPGVACGDHPEPHPRVRRARGLRAARRAARAASARGRRVDPDGPRAGGQADA